MLKTVEMSHLSTRVLMRLTGQCTSKPDEAARKPMLNEARLDPMYEATRVAEANGPDTSKPDEAARGALMLNERG